MSVRITYINKSSGHHENPYTSISHLGWINEENNKEGKSTRTEMYRWIMDGGLAYVRDDYGNVANVITAETPSGKRYVKTKPDDIKSDNILKLPECC